MNPRPRQAFENDRLLEFLEVRSYEYEFTSYLFTPHLVLPPQGGKRPTNNFRSWINFKELHI
jgi:hypothetical protein